MKEKVYINNGIIQGLFAPESACQSFWTLKARVELSSFNEQKGEKVNE